MVYDFRKLKAKIREIFDNQREFAKALGISYAALNQRLNNITDWKAPEMAKACELLGIPLTELPLYFFVPKV